MRILVIASLLTSAAFARAETIPDPEHEIESARTKKTPAEPTKIRAAIAVNPPIGWFLPEKSFGVSAYVAPEKHHVIRANLARYWWPPNQVPVALLREETEGPYNGHVLDVGLSWMFFWRRAFDGPSIEVGLVHRSSEGDHLDVLNGHEDLVDTRYIAARGLVGWSWSIRDRVFTSFQLGFSHGHVGGSETRCASECTNGVMPKVTVVDRTESQIEAFWRIGVAFDLI